MRAYLIKKLLTNLTLLTLPLTLNAASADSEKINQEIHDLEIQLEAHRKDALNKEIEAQPRMFEDWDTFSKDIQQVEDNEKAIERIKLRLEQLKNNTKH